MSYTRTRELDLRTAVERAVQSAVHIAYHMLRRLLT
jgi:hypothetical protein